MNRLAVPFARNLETREFGFISVIADVSIALLWTGNAPRI